MSLALLEGCDDGMLTQKWTTLTGVTLTASGRNGNGMSIIRSSTSSNVALKIVKPEYEHATMTLGFAVYPNTGGTLGTGAVYGLCGFHGDASVTRHVTISLNSDGTLTARRGLGNGTALGTSTLAGPLIVPDQWNYVEVKVTLHDTTGAVEIKINETVVLTLTNVDTKNAGTDAVFDSFHLGSPSTSSAAHALVFDDIYLTNGAGSVNTGYLRDIAVETLYPNGNGDSSQLVGSDGNSTDNYLLVDEAGTPNTADYVQSTTTNFRDLYAYGDLVRTTGTVYGVQATAYAQKSDSGTRAIKAVAWHDPSSSGLEEATGQTLATTWEPKSFIFEEDPNGPAAWTIAGVNAAEFGVIVA